MCSRIPYGSKYFKFYDLSDAFHSCKIHPSCEDLLVVQFGDEFYQYTGGAQGIANMAVHWNIHLMDAFDKILGYHWREWYTLYVDDLGCHGKTKQQAHTRGRILEAMLTVLNKPFSDKTGEEFKSSLDIAGLHFTDRGVRLSDDSIQSLTSAPTAGFLPFVATGAEGRKQPSKGSPPLGNIIIIDAFPDLQDL